MDRTEMAQRLSAVLYAYDQGASAEQMLDILDPKPVECLTCKAYRRGYNVAVANGLIARAVSFDRMMKSHERNGHDERAH